MTNRKRLKRRKKLLRARAARPQLAAQPPVHGVEMLRRFDTSTFQMIASIESSRAWQRRALQEAIAEAR